MSRKLSGVLLVIGLIAAATTSFLVWREFAIERNSVLAGLAEARRSLADTAQRIDQMLASIVPVVEATASELDHSATAVTPAVLRHRLEQQPMLMVLGLAYERFSFNPHQRLHAPFAVRRADGEIGAVQLENAVDYTEFSHRWYGEPILEGKAWNDPLLLEPAGSPLATYAVPFFRPGVNRDQAAPIGIVLGGVSLNAMAQPLNALTLGRSGYAFVFTGTGRLVSHPRRELVSNQRTVFETAWAEGDTTRHKAAVQALKGQRGLIAADDAATGQAGWIAFEPIPSVGWTVAAVLYRNDYRPSVDSARHRLFAATVSGLVAALCLVLGALAFVFEGRGSRNLLAAPAVVIVLLMVGIAALWAIFDHYPAGMTEGRVSVYDGAAAENYLDGIAEDGAGATLAQLPVQAAPVRIPTGVFIQSIKFESGTDVAIKGNIWQRYRKREHAEVPRGFTLPDAEQVTVEEVYRRDGADEEVIGWSFSGVFRQQFSFSRYPFDRQDVSVRLRHADRLHRVALTPDYAAYDATAPGVRPGVDNEIVLPEWDVTGSGFDYRRVHYTTNFGIDAETDTSELFYSVSLRRRFFGPFVAYLLPLAVTLAMVYGILLISSKHQGSAFLGYTAMDVVVGCSALFFVASIQHTALTAAVGSSTVMYFEYFYFTLYVAIMLVSLNGFLFAAHQGIRVIEYRDNLIPKLTFWPAYLLVVLVVTYQVLY